MSIRFKVILPYLILTLVVAATGAYIVTSLVARSLNERLSNQLLQVGREVSDEMVRQEQKHVDSALVLASTVGFPEALDARDEGQLSALAAPTAGGQKVESLLVFDAQGQEVIHLLRQTNGSMLDVSQPGRGAPFSFVSDLVRENNPDSLPRRTLQIDPVDGRYYYFTALPVEYDGRVAGTVAVGTSLNTILPWLKSTSLADIIFYGEDGQAIPVTAALYYWFTWI